MTPIFSNTLVVFWKLVNEQIMFVLSSEGNLKSFSK